MIVIAGTARIRAEKREQAEVATRKAEAATRQEPGNRAYRFAWDVDDENVVHVFEEWDDEAALTGHFETPHLAEFIAALGEVLDGDPEFLRYDVSEKKSLFG